MNASLLITAAIRGKHPDATWPDKAANLLLASLATDSALPLSLSPEVLSEYQAVRALCEGPDREVALLELGRMERELARDL